MPDDAAIPDRPRPTRLLRVSLIVLAAGGVLIAGVLVRLSTPGDGPAEIFGAQVCSTTNTVDCGYVLASRWATVGPIPTAVLGLAYFLILEAWFVVVGLPNHRGRRWHLLPLLLVSIGCAGSAWFMYLMAFRLPVWCTWCVAAHVVNILLLVLSCAAWPRRASLRPLGAEAVAAYPSNTRGLAVVTASVAIILLTVVGGVAFRAQVMARTYLSRYLAATNNVDYLEWRYRQATMHDIPLRPDELTIGPADATFTVVAFTDFECSKCRAFFLSTAGLVERFPGKLRCVFKHYPVSSACNPAVAESFHYFSCEAALAAEAAHDAGSPEQSLDYHRRLYANMSRLDQRPYQALAKEVGIEPGMFQTALEAGAGRERLDQDIALARRLGVNATPAIFLNGRRLPTWKIVTTGARHRLDMDKTVALWERLLGETSKR